MVAIEDLKSTSAGNIAETNVTVPSTGDLLDEDPFLKMQNTLNRLAAANASFNSSFNSSFRNFCDHCSFGHSNNGCDVFYSRPSCGSAARNSFSK